MRKLTTLVSLIFLILFVGSCVNRSENPNDLIEGLIEQKQELMAQQQEDLQALQHRMSERETWYENRINKLSRLISKAETNITTNR